MKIEMGGADAAPLRPKLIKILLSHQEAPSNEFIAKCSLERRQRAKRSLEGNPD
jgi:hypothetical protein